MALVENMDACNCYDHLKWPWSFCGIAVRPGSTTFIKQTSSTSVQCLMKSAISTYLGLPIPYTQGVFWLPKHQIPWQSSFITISFCDAHNLIFLSLAVSTSWCFCSGSSSTLWWKCAWKVDNEWRVKAEGDVHWSACLCLKSGLFSGSCWWSLPVGRLTVEE